MTSVLKWRSYYWGDIFSIFDFGRFRIVVVQPSWLDEPLENLEISITNVIYPTLKLKLQHMLSKKGCHSSAEARDEHHVSGWHWCRLQLNASNRYQEIRNEWRQRKLSGWRSSSCFFVSTFIVWKHETKSLKFFAFGVFANSKASRYYSWHGKPLRSFTKKIPKDIFEDTISFIPRR